MTGNVTYGQFKNSLGDFNYNINKIYLNSTNLSQISGVFKFMKYDSDGNQNFQTVISALDPYQRQNSLIIETEKKGLIINGRDSASFNMQPNTQLILKLYVSEVTNQDELKGEDSFTIFDNLSNDGNFFKDYKDYI